MEAKIKVLETQRTKDATKQVLAILEKEVPKDYSESVDVVKELRAIINGNNHLWDDLYSFEGSDYGYHLFQDKWKDIRSIWYNLDDDGDPVPLWAEQDVTIIQITRDNPDTEKGCTDEELAFHLLRCFMMFDCSGCCNAIEYCRVSKYGAIMYIDSGQTFHS